MSGQAPTVSVVMAVYNEEKYVSMAIESILEQTFSDFEFLIVDDGSTDRTSEIVDGYAKSDNRVRLLTNKKNMGLPASLNKGIEAARGEYIARMDADDKSLPGRFERQVKYLDSNPETHVIGCQVRVIGANGEYFGYRRFSAGPRSPNEMKQTGPKVAHPSVMMRRSSVISVGKYRESFKYAQDLDLWVRMSRKFGYSFLHVLQAVLFEYRITPGKYRRNQIGHIYASFAGDFTSDDQLLEERLSSALKKRQVKNRPLKNRSIYNYTAGRLLLGKEHRGKAVRRFLFAIIQWPLNPQGWYGIILLLSSLISNGCGSPRRQ
jgi:glycosyltransferase involved in cell wall biosynthesis